MKRYLPLILTLLLLSGCGGRRMEKSLPVVTETPEAETVFETAVILSPSPEILPEPTREPDSVTSPEPVPVTTPEPELPGEALALLTLADTDRVLDKAVGDLNGDGVEDWAVVIEGPPEEGREEEELRAESRTLVILLGKEEGGFALGQSNERLIRRSDEGGVYGDPYAGIVIEDGELCYSTYGGSSLRWSEENVFHWVGDGLELKAFYEVYFWVFGYLTNSAVYDFTAGEYRKYMAESSEEGEGWLVWREELLVEPPRLEELGDLSEGQPWRGELPPLPQPAREGAQTLAEGAVPRHSAEELLDKAREKYHPDMERVDIPWTEETRANYSAILGYEVPGYYYANGRGILSYDGLEVWGEGREPYQHRIWYRGQDWEESEIYWYLDETGEEAGTVY